MRAISGPGWLDVVRQGQLVSKAEASTVRREASEIKFAFIVCIMEAWGEVVCADDEKRKRRRSRAERSLPSFYTHLQMPSMGRRRPGSDTVRHHSSADPALAREEDIFGPIRSRILSLDPCSSLLSRLETLLKRQFSTGSLAA